MKNRLETVKRVIKIGEQYIYPFRKKEWKKYVLKSFCDIYSGKDIIYSLEIMKTLHENSGDLGIAKSKEILYNPNHLNIPNRVLSLVGRFSKRGVEFFYSVVKQDGYQLSYDEVKEIEDIQIENIKLKNEGTQK